MPVAREGDQLVAGAAPEFQYAPALPIGAGPIEVDRGAAAGEHQVVQPRVRVKRCTHQRLLLPGSSAIGLWWWVTSESMSGQLCDDRGERVSRICADNYVREAAFL